MRARIVSHEITLAAASLLAGAMLLPASPTAVNAQALGVEPGRDLPGWLERWSPLTTAGDLPRRLPSASAQMPHLLLPVPGTGLFWTGGNPGALPWDVTDRRGDLSASLAGEDGDYRRPLDPASSTVARFGGMAWQPIAPRAAVIGRVLFDRTEHDPSSTNVMNDPYASSPFVVTDTTRWPMRQTHARLEGAGGWRLGSWGLGLSAGHDARTTSSVAAPLSRANRAVFSGGTLGVVRDMNEGRWQVGVHGRWQVGEETVTIRESAAEGAVHQLEGYQEVPLQSIQSFFYRRISRDVRSAGASVGGMIGPARWTVHAEGVRLRDDLTGQQQADPVYEHWVTSGATAGGAVQWPLMSGRMLLTATGRLATLNGHVEQVFPTRQGIEADEKVMDGTVQLRLLPTAQGWMAVADVSVRTEQRERTDSIAEARTNIDAITPRLGIEVGRQLSPRLMLSGGYAIARYGGNGTIPGAGRRGPLYQRVFAPELDMATEVSMAQAVSLSARWQLRGDAALWLTGRMERLSPEGLTSVTENEGSRAPGGTRNARSVWMGVTLAPRTLGAGAT